MTTAANTLGTNRRRTGTRRATAAGPRSGSAAAFTLAVIGAGVTSRVGFGHELPSQPEDVVIHLSALACAVVAGWWLANVLAWAATLRRGGTIERFTLPGTKRIAQLLLAAALSTSCVADSTDDPVMVLVSRDAPIADTTSDPPPTTSTSTAPPTTAPPTTAPPTTAPPTTVAPPSDPPIADGPAPSMPVERASDDHTAAAIAIAEHQRIVVSGDNFWTITADTLAVHGLDDPTCEQIAGYWSQVVAANRVRSGNPDLLGVGETITLPAHEIPA